MILSPSLFLHSVIMCDLCWTNFYDVAPSVLAADWPPTALLVSHSNSCRWPFLKWETFFFFFFVHKQTKQSSHCRVLPAWCWLVWSQTRQTWKINTFLRVAIQKKATKRAILFAVVNNEAPVITSDSERARCVHPHIQQQRSVCLTNLQQVEKWHARKWHAATLKPLCDRFFFFFSCFYPDIQ